jgi:hypothetical protein
LEKAVKKSTDTLTKEVAVARVKDLNLPAVLPAEKVPLFYKDALAVAKTEAAPKKPTRPSMSDSGSGSGFSRSFSSNTRGTTAPDVERELKALGWDAVKGQWTKKGPNIFEGTNARLEAKKMIGGVDVTVWKGYTGSIIAAVRDESSDTEYMGYASSSSGTSSSRFSSYHSVNGYGLLLGKDCKLFAPGSWSGWGGFGSSSGKYESYLYNSYPLTEAPKYHLTVMLAEPSFDALLNDKKLLHKNDKDTPARGQFVLEIDGTATLEVPRAAGK